MKPFTTIAALLLLLIAIVHIYRLYSGMPVIVNGQTLPLWMSYVGVAVPGFLGIMLFMEARR